VRIISYCLEGGNGRLKNASSFEAVLGSSVGVGTLIQSIAAIVPHVERAHRARSKKFSYPWLQ